METQVEKTIQECYLEVTPYSQRFFLGKDYRIVHIAESGEGETMDMYVELDHGSRKARELLPATYFYVFKSSEKIRAGLEYVGTVPMRAGQVWHIYKQPNS